MVQKSENQSPKIQWTQQIRKRPKKAKIKGQILCFRSVDMIIINSPKYGPKKRKSKPKKNSGYSR